MTAVRARVCKASTNSGSDIVTSTEMAGASEGFERIDPPESFGGHALCAKLGEGGMAQVYLAVRARALGDSQVVALKRLQMPMHDARARSMFLDEVRIVSRL